MYISIYQVFKYKFCHKNNMSCSSIHTENTLIKSFSPFSAPGEAGAGLWGTVDACDVPFSLVDSLFKHLSSIQDQVSTKPYCQNQVCTEPHCQDQVSTVPHSQDQIVTDPHTGKVTTEPHTRSCLY